MLQKRVIEQIKRLGKPDLTSQEAINHWHEHTDDYAFLKSVRYGDVPLHIVTEGLIAFSVVVPIDMLDDPDYISKLLAWNFQPSSGYGYGINFNRGQHTYFLSEPMDEADVDILETSTPVFFNRSFSGYRPNHNYFEMNQRISHVLDLHWVVEKNAWCEWNSLGEIVPLAHFYKDDDVTCCTLDRDKLDIYLFLAKSVIVQLFEFSRYINPGAPGRPVEETERFDDENEIFSIWKAYESDVGRMTFMRGFQIIRCGKSDDQMGLIVEGKQPRQYATFIIQDWKNQRVIEWSCDPEQPGNYFTSSDLPFTTSPAFFKPEVLSQYRQNPSQYHIGERDVRSYHAWSLTYDINEAGQVFVYIYDFNKVPYEVQLHWKAFNEPPKAPISERYLKLISKVNGI